MYFDSVFHVLSSYLYCFCVNDENIMYCEQCFTLPPLFQILCCSTGVERMNTVCALLPLVRECERVLERSKRDWKNAVCIIKVWSVMAPIKKGLEK